MKKNKKIAIITIILIIIILLSIFINIYIQNKKYSYKLSDTITSKSWSREGKNDTETIVFGKDGHFTYYCSCGNAVDNFDLCDSYNYNNKEKKIKVNCHTKNKTIILKKATEYELVLEIDGEERIFNSPDAHLKNNPLEFAGIKFISQNKEITLSFTKDGEYKAYDSKKKEFTLGSDVCWWWKYSKDDNTITIECNDQSTKNIIIKEYNKNTSELKLFFPEENKTIIFNKK
jgi:plastocyanin